MGKVKKLFYVLLASIAILIVEITVAAPPTFSEKPYEYTLDSSWTKVNSPLAAIFPDSYVFKKNENIKLNIIYSTKNKAGLPITKNNQIHPDFLAGRRKVVEGVGIQNWNISQHDVTKKGPTTILSLIGSFTGPDGKLKKFEERHYFQDEKYVAARLSYNEKEKDNQALETAHKSFEQLKMR